MPSSADFLAHATRGLNYVKSKIDLGSDNKFGNMLAKLAIPRLAVRSAREHEDALLKAQGIPVLGPRSTDWMRHGFEYIQTFALAAGNMGAGNCQELAAMAFMYFYDRDILPVDYMMKPGHAFCVIGAPVMPTRSNFIEWSTGTATVCDPWEGRAEFACHLARRYPGSLKDMQSYYRVEPQP